MFTTHDKRFPVRLREERKYTNLPTETVRESGSFNNPWDGLMCWQCEYYFVFAFLIWKWSIFFSVHRSRYRAKMTNLYWYLQENLNLEINSGWTEVFALCWFFIVYLFYAWTRDKQTSHIQYFIRVNSRCFWRFVTSSNVNSTLILAYLNEKVTI